MSQTNQCPECGTELPASAPRELCPACLLKRGLESNTAGYTGEKARWTPPGVEELASRFPELEITRLIGRGGMGAVYQGRQKNLDRVVALKILPPEMAHDPAFAERFAREAQAMARLNHPHIAAIHEFGQRGGWFYFIMEYVDGVSLRGLLDSGHVSPKEALAIVPQICDALQYAHDQGIVHRDIKPENILLNKNGQVKIADFGLAKLMGQSPLSLGEGGRLGDRGRGSPDETTGPNTDTVSDKKIMGTPQYMAPEQLERPSEVDHRADIYSLGVVFYQMLTGELPVGRFAPPSQKVQIDVRLDEVVLRALEKEPAKRYQLVSEVKTQVETIVGTPRSVGMPSPSISPPPSTRGPMFCFGLIYAIFMIFLIGSGGMLPSRVASHFDAEGLANGWMGRDFYLMFLAAVPLVMGTIFWWTGKLSRVMPAEYVRVPNRSHWLSPEHREEAAIILQRHMLVWACVMTMFFGGLHWLTILANASSPPRLAMGPLLFLTIALLVALMIWVVHLLMRYAEPRRNRPQAFPSNPESISPHFSHAAIAGAAWLSASIFGVMMLAVVFEGEAPWWQKLFGYALMFVTVTAPFVVTVLGWIAIAQIRRSAERLYGMGLAVFDALVFPLLTLDGLFAGSLIAAVSLFLKSRYKKHWPHSLLEIGLLFLAAFPFLAAADFLVVRRVWRKVHKPLEGTGSTTSVPRTRSRTILAYSVISIMLIIPVMGLLFFEVWAPPGKPTPFNLRSQPVAVVIEEAGAKLDEPWAWQELESRLKDGKLTAADATLAIERLTQTMRAKSPEGYNQPLSWQSEFIGDAFRVKLIPNAQMLRLADAFYGPLPRFSPPLPRLRQGATRLMVQMNTGNTWQQEFPIQQFNRLHEIRIDGSPVRPEGDNWSGSWAWYFTLHGPFAVGTHTMEVDFDTLLIDRATAVGIDNNTPAKDWPPGLRRWRRTATAAFTVYPADAVIVKLNSDPARNPTADIAVDPIVIRSSGAGKKLVVTIKPLLRVVDIPVSFDVEIKFGDQLVPAGSFWIFRQPEGRNQWSGGLLSVDIKTLADNLTRADVILKPSPGGIEFEPRVNEIWGQEIIIRGVELRRYDLDRAVESQPTATQPAGHN